MAKINSTAYNLAVRSLVNHLKSRGLTSELVRKVDRTNFQRALTFIEWDYEIQTMPEFGNDHLKLIAALRQPIEEMPAELTPDYLLRKESQGKYILGVVYNGVTNETPKVYEFKDWKELKRRVDLVQALASSFR